MKIRPLTENFAVSPQLHPRDVAQLAAQGYKTIINNRPDGEAWGQPRGAEIEAQAQAHGLAYHHVPVSNRGLAPGQVEKIAAIQDQAGGPVLAFCRSGTRSAHAWALSQAGKMAAEDIIRAAAAAGYDVRALEPFLR